ncbi:MAG: hypothetical protein HYY84_19705 [Deltaproteobacteria bacterium]|nr:hypothetical protein [Deltaproteobacteria bacterium]
MRKMVHVLCIVGLAFGLEEVVHAKAHKLAGFAAVEAVITAVESTDNPGDSDYNFILRPVQPGDSYYPTAFPKSPVSIAGSTAKVFISDFLDTFWANGNAHGYFQDWVRSRLQPTLDKVKSDGAKWSEQCKACAGSGGDGTGCWLMKKGSCPGGPCGELWPGGPNHPCKKLFSCRECLYDIWRLGGEDSEYTDDLSHYTPKAEIFIGENSECTADNSPCNDIGSKLIKVMEGIGVKVSATDSADWFDVESLFFGCKEISWDGTKWVKDATSALSESPCGKHVLLVGPVSFDGSHEGRPEIHPISAILIAREEKVVKALGTGKTASLTRRFSVGTFIDGSTESGGDWSFNYRVGYGAEYLPTKVQVALDILQGNPPPGKWSGEAGSATYGGWKSACAWNQNAEHNLNGKVSEIPQPSSEPKLCPALQVDMNFGKPAGAAWAGEATVGWTREDVDVTFAMKAKLETPGGILATGSPPFADPPVSAPPPPKASATPPKTPEKVPGPKIPFVGSLWPKLDLVALLEPTCDVKFDPKKSTGWPRRWYRFKVETDATIDKKIDPKRVAWLFNTSRSDMKIDPAQPAEMKTGKQSFSVWLSVGSGASGQTTVWDPWSPAPYIGRLDAKILGDGKEIMAESADVVAAHPVVRLLAEDAAVSQTKKGLVYTLSLKADARRFCGKNWVYAWRKDGVPLAGVTGTGPVKLTLAPGQAEKYEVVVKDEWGVETTGDARVVKAPSLVAELSKRCAAGAIEEKPFVLPAGFPVPEGAANLTQEICRKVELMASVSEAGLGAKFPKTNPKLKYYWSDLKYAAASTSNQSVAIPKAWLGPPWEKKKAIPGIDVLMRKPPLGGSKPAAAPAKACGVGEKPMIGSTTLVLTPPKDLQYFTFHATVTAVDEWGRCASASVAGSNDVTPPAKLAKAFSFLGKMIYGDKPMPEPDPCGGLCGGKPFTDPADRAFALLVGRASTAAKLGARGGALLRDAYERFRGTAIARVGMERRGLKFAPLVPSSLGPVMRGHNRKKIQWSAKFDMFKRLRGEPITPQR